MAGFVMMGLIFVLIVYISIAKKKKRAVGISMVLIGLFYLYVSYSCGPNSADVKVMKPMAQKISEYIVKNGIPESLKDIPDLPYGLEGCEKQQENLEQCTFYKNNKEYESEIYILGDVYIKIYCKQTKTGLRYELKKNYSTKHWLINKRNISFSSKNTGICNPMRQ